MNITDLTKQARKVLKLKYCGAVIVAAGNASRMEGIDKVMAPINGEPMILRTVRTFQECDAIREIVVVTRQDLLVTVMGLCKNFDKVRAVVVGGKDRPESVSLGMAALSNKVKLVAVQDGARPLVTWQVVVNAIFCFYNNIQNIADSIQLCCRRLTPGHVQFERLGFAGRKICGNRLIFCLQLAQ